MAETFKEVDTVNVTLIDDQMNEQTFKINNPLTNLTLSQVRTAFSGLIASGSWYDKYQRPFTQVARATKVQVTTYTKDLE